MVAGNPNLLCLHPSCLRAVWDIWGGVDIHPPAGPAQRGTKLPLAGLEEGCPSEQQSQFGRTSQHPAKPALTSPAVMKHS